jgi:hypothetical protein
LPSLDPHVGVLRIQFYGPGVAPGPLRGHQHRAAAGEAVQDDALAVAAVADGVGDQADWLDCRVQCQQSTPLATVDAGVCPEVGPVAAVLPQLEVVDVRASPFLNAKTSSCGLR